MTDTGGAILLSITAFLLLYLVDVIQPLNRPSEIVRYGTFCLALSIGSVAGIYAAFSVGVDTGAALRPWLKIFDGMFAGLAAWLYWQVLTGRADRGR